MKKIFLSTLLIIILSIIFTSVSYAKTLSHSEISQAYYKSYNYEKSGNIKDSIKALQLVYSEYPTGFTVNNRLAYLYSLNKNYNNAISHYKKAIFSLPNSLTPKIGLLSVYILSEQYSSASKLGYQILSIDHYNYFGNLKLAHVLRKTKKYDLSEKILTGMLMLYPSDTLYLTELGLLHFEQNHWKKAKDIMKNVLILEPENFSAKKTLLSIEK
jgi:tetratricopeptide (TPR) repeat protein